MSAWSRSIRLDELLRARAIVVDQRDDAGQHRRDRRQALARDHVGSGTAAASSSPSWRLAPVGPVEGLLQRMLSGSSCRALEDCDGQILDAAGGGGVAPERVSPCPDCAARLARSGRSACRAGSARDPPARPCPRPDGSWSARRCCTRWPRASTARALPIWRLWVVLGVTFVATVAALLPDRAPAPLSPLCGAGPLRRRCATEPRSAAPPAATVLRATGAADGRRRSAGAAGIILPNRGWLRVGRAFFTTQVETAIADAGPGRGRRRTSRATAVSAGRTSWCPTSRSARDASGTRDVPRALFERGVHTTSTPRPTTPTPARSGSSARRCRGHRDKIFVATKFCRPDRPPAERHAGARRSSTEVEKSLQRLQTDHVDLIHIHSCDRVERLMAPNIHEAFDRLKEQGKVRFLGVVDAHAEPRRGREHGDRLRPLRRHDARVPLRHVADASATSSRRRSSTTSASSR